MGLPGAEVGFFFDLDAEKTNSGTLGSDGSTICWSCAGRTQHSRTWQLSGRQPWVLGICHESSELNQG